MTSRPLNPLRSVTATQEHSGEAAAQGGRVGSGGGWCWSTTFRSQNGLGTGRRRGRDDRGRDDWGSAAVEAAVVAPAFLALLLLVVFAGRVVNAGNEVESAAAAAARAASQMATPVGATTEAEQVATAALSDAGVTCDPSRVEVDTHLMAPGGSVTVRIRCTAQLGDMTMIALPGHQTFQASATEVVDTYRGGG
jgi:Flp pilus assembly protein TadG